jgi:hypothetical protein
MDDIVTKNSQLVQWLRHDEDSVSFLQDGTEFLKELLVPADEELVSHPTEGECAGKGDQIGRIFYYEGRCFSTIEVAQFCGCIVP